MKMKRDLLVFLFAMTTFLCVNAQENEMYIKSMLGGTLSTLTNLDNTKMKLGLVAGGEFGYRISNPFAVTAGVLISMQGTAFKDGNAKKEDALSTLTYINIPILANLYIVRGLAIKAGIQPAYLLSRSWTHDDYYINNIDYRTITNGTRKFDLSIPMGLSYEFSNFVFDFRYNLGLSTISSHADTHNSVFMLTFGYKTLFK